MSDGPEEWLSKIRGLGSTLKSQYSEAAERVSNSTSPVGEAKGVFVDVFTKIYGKAESVAQEKVPTLDALKDHARAFADAATKKAEAHVSALQEKVGYMQKTGQLLPEVMSPLSDIGPWLQRSIAYLQQRIFPRPSLSDRIKSFFTDRIWRTMKKYTISTVTAMATEVDTTLRSDPKFYFCTSLLVAIGPRLLMLPLAALTALFYSILSLVGFGVAGVQGGSMAASWQSSMRNVPAGSLFSLLQSLAATYDGLSLALPYALGWFIRLLALSVAVYIWVTML